MSLKLASVGYNLLCKSVFLLWKNMCDVFILNFIFTQPLRQRPSHISPGGSTILVFYRPSHYNTTQQSTFIQVSAGTERKRGEFQPTLGAEMAGLSCGSTDKQSWEEQASIPGKRNRKCQSKGRKMQTSPKVWGWVAWRGRSCSQEGFLQGQAVLRHQGFPLGPRV